jgi:uroporphyrinogen decarboxylase
MCSDDLGLQNGLMVSPECYREVIKPRHRKYFDLVHENSPAKVFFHTCGAVGEIIEDLIEIGVEVLHPVQVSATGMDPETLKRRFGRRLAFWGAVDTQHTLPHGSVQDVRAEVSRLIDVLGEGGGYVLGAVHNVQPDVPVDNLVALFEHGRDHGRG